MTLNEEASFNCTAIGVGELAIQWEVDGVVYVNETCIVTHQSTLRPPDVRIVYRKIGIYMVHMGDNDMHGARGGKKRGHKHSPS